jgi:pyrroline-5-carboxylate reductase
MKAACGEKMAKNEFGPRRIGFLGTGNMNQAIMNALITSNAIPASQIGATNRTDGKLHKVSEKLGIKTYTTNEELVEKSDVVVLGVKPQDLGAALEPIASTFHAGHIVMSLAAGVTLRHLKKFLPDAGGIVRVMPNTPIRIGKGVIGYCMAQPAHDISRLVETLFSPMGLVIKVEEGEKFEALTVAASSGIGFVFELMEYWQEWLEEHDFDPDQAKKMTIQTFLGAAELAHLESALNLDELRSKVVSKKGVTAAGLDSMRELEIERALRYSFEKAVLRDRELGQSLSRDLDPRC